jgi:hypothetical protein
MLEYGWNILIVDVGTHDIPFHATHLNDLFQKQLILLFSYVMAMTNNDCMGIWVWGGVVCNTHAHDFIVITHAFPTQISNSSIFLHFKDNNLGQFLNLHYSIFPTFPFAQINHSFDKGF